MPFFVPTDPKAKVHCYTEAICSVDSPVHLEGFQAEKATNNPDFTTVIEGEVVKKKATRKKRASKK